MKTPSWSTPHRFVGRLVPSLAAALLGLHLLAACSPDPVGDGGPDPLISELLRSIPDPQPLDPIDLVEPAGEYREVRDGEIWVCRQFDVTTADSSDDFPLLDDNADVLWPGAALQGGSLWRATPDPITAPRGPGSVVITNITGSSLSSVSFEETTLSSVIGAANDLIAAQPESFPADLSISILQVRNREELQVALRANADFFGVFSARASLDLQQDERYSHFLVVLRQNFYSLVFQRPSEPHLFFADGVRLEDVAPHVGPDNPATYVSRVTYGRVYYLLIESIEESLDMESTLSANFFFGSVDGQGRYVTDMRGLKISAHAYGGDQAYVLDSIYSGLSGLNAFKEDLAGGNQIEYAKPVFSSVRSVATDQLIRNGYQVGYTYSECNPVGELCTPTLISPNPGAVLDNGCRNAANSVSWPFSWSGFGSCELEIEEYELWVEHPDYGRLSAITAHDVTSHTFRFPEPFSGNLLTGWTWKVRTRTYGVWGPWSQGRSFSVERVDSDCLTGVQLFTHPDFAQGSIFLEGDAPNLERIPGWDDEIDSINLHNLRGVRLYEDPDYQGASFYFDHSCPDVQLHRSHGFRKNRASSMKLYR